MPEAGLIENHHVQPSLRGNREDGVPQVGSRGFRGSGLRALLILQLVYVMNFLDRQIVGILATPIKADLHLSDTQLGLMGGLAFAIFYTGLGIPIAWLADRRSRVKIISLALFVWSAFTAACGLAQNFAQLFLCRTMVGVGEAGGVAPSYSLVSDSFPQAQRGRALSLLLVGIPLGSAAGILLGGLIASAINWRTAFIVVGAMGVFLAPLVRLGVPEPIRGAHDPAERQAPKSFTATMTFLAQKSSFWLLSLGASSGAIIGYGSAFWLPSVFQRSYGLSLSQTALFYGSVVLIGGTGGVAIGGRLADRFGTRSLRAYALIPAIAFLLCVPFYAAAIFSPRLIIAWPLLVLAQALALIWAAPAVTAIQHIAFPSMRASASASFQLINNLVGLGIGTVAIGFISDQLTRRIGPDALRWSILSGLGFYIIAAILYFLASRCLRRDWIEPHSER